MAGPVRFTLESDVFKDGSKIDSVNSCENGEVSPGLHWAGAPESTKTFALIVDDPDAPTAEPYVHWVIYNIPASTKNLADGIERKPLFEDGMMQGLTTAEHIGYDGPCPPSKENHRYYFKMYALDAKLSVEPGLTKKQLLAAMEGHILGEAVLLGTYQKLYKNIK